MCVRIIFLFAEKPLHRQQQQRQQQFGVKSLCQQEAIIRLVPAPDSQTLGSRHLATSYHYHHHQQSTLIATHTFICTATPTTHTVIPIAARRQFANATNRLCLCRRPFATDVNLPNRLTCRRVAATAVSHSIATNAAGASSLTTGAESANWAPAQPASRRHHRRRRRRCRSHETETQNERSSQRGRVSVLVPSTIGALLSTTSLHRVSRGQRAREGVSSIHLPHNRSAAIYIATILVTDILTIQFATMWTATINYLPLFF